MEFLQRLATLLVAVGPAVPLAFILIAVGHRTAATRFAPLACIMGAFAALSSLLGLVFQPLGTAIDAPALGAAVHAFLMAGAAEEAAKLLLLVTIVLKHADVDPRRDAILASAWLALGFAMLENFLFVASNPAWLIVGAARATIAVPVHLALGLIMGALVVRALEGRVSIFTAFLIPAVLHGLYDWPLMVMLAGRTELAPADLSSAWALSFALLVTSLWLLIRGPVCAVFLETQERQGVAAFRRNSIPAFVHSAAGVVARLLRWGAVAIVLLTVGAGLLLETSYAVLGVAAVMPLAFSDLWRRCGARRS